jgi:hypothetical protein
MDTFNEKKLRRNHIWFFAKIFYKYLISINLNKKVL